MRRMIFYSYACVLALLLAGCACPKQKSDAFSDAELKRTSERLYELSYAFSELKRSGGLSPLNAEKDSGGFDVMHVRNDDFLPDYMKNGSIPEFISKCPDLYYADITETAGRFNVWFCYKEKIEDRVLIYGQDKDNGWTLLKDAAVPAQEIISKMPKPEKVPQDR